MSEELAAAVETKLAPVDERVALERAAYRSAPGAAWRRAQVEAVARGRAKARERYQAWRERTTATAAGREQLRARSRRLAREFANATVEE